jgi:hypothetical protein
MVIVQNLAEVLSGALSAVACSTAECNAAVTDKPFLRAQSCSGQSGCPECCRRIRPDPRITPSFDRAPPLPG